MFRPRLVIELSRSNGEKQRAQVSLGAIPEDEFDGWRATGSRQGMSHSDSQKVFNPLIERMRICALTWRGHANLLSC